MKKYVLGILVGLCLPMWGACQESMDSSYTTIGLEVFVNRSFENLTSRKILEENPLTKGIPFCNIAACLAILEVSYQDPNVNQAIFTRLEELSERLYMEGTPVILTTGCFSDEQLLNENRKGWLEVCLGNSCIVHGKSNEGMKIFNEKTRALVRN